MSARSISAIDAVIGFRSRSAMRAQTQIPLRFIPSAGHFTLPILRKPLMTTLLPLSLKKFSPNAERYGMRRLHLR